MSLLLLRSDLRFPCSPITMATIFIILIATGMMHASAASLTVEKSVVCEGSWANASFVLPYDEDQPQGERDDGGYGFAAFFEKGARNDGWVGGTKYFNNGEGKEVKMSFRAPHKLGQYEFRLFRDPYNQIMLASKPVDIVKCPPSGAYVDTPKTVCQGQLANITAWLPIEEDDRFDGSGFVALYNSGTNEQIGGTRSGVNDNCMGNCRPRPIKFPLTFDMPPGDYEWRMFGDYFGSYLLETFPVQVSKCDASNPQDGTRPDTGDYANPKFPQLGNRISVDEIGQYFGEWTRIEGTDTFNAIWNGQITDVIEVKSIDGDQVTFYRRGNDGYYYGTLNGDGTITGTASWYEPGWTWSGTIEREGI
jgi:hypothetical protein